MTRSAPRASARPTGAPAALLAILLASLAVAIPIAVPLSPPSAAAQEPEHGFDDYMTKQYLTCRDVAVNCFDLVPHFFYTNRADSLFALLDYWEGKCGHAEPILRTRLLAAIWEGSFTEAMLDEDIIHQLLWYRQRHMPLEERRHSLWDYGYLFDEEMETMEALADYDLFTEDLADQLLPHAEEGSLEQLLCLYYAGDHDALWREIREERFAGTALREAYQEDVAAYRGVSDAEFVLYGGMWDPRGALGLLGPMPLVGGQVGVRGLRWLARLTGEVRLGGADDYYAVRHQDELVWTDRFLGTYVGIDLGLQLLRTRRHGLELFGGIGYEGIQALTGADYVDEYGEPDAKWLSSLNTSLGTGYRLYLGQTGRSFLGLEARLEDTHHGNDGGTDLSGDALSYRLLIGWSPPDFKTRRLAALHADRWER